MASLLRSNRRRSSQYAVIVAGGHEPRKGEKALPPVKDAIGSFPQDTKTITLTCGKRMTR